MFLHQVLLHVSSIHNGPAKDTIFYSENFWLSHQFEVHYFLRLFLDLSEESLLLGPSHLFVALVDPVRTSSRIRIEALQWRLRSMPSHRAALGFGISISFTGVHFFLLF